jgi:[1-hydroxy-2-(trimethylamino)ethyl]phosphonate dioxygenase
MSACDEIFAFYERQGGAAYFGEQVSMLEHGLQTAYFARETGASPALTVAALLHDIGHLLESVPADIADWKNDARHEELGGAWLARLFPPQVSDPVRLHVPAKRYLCATDPDYLAELSPASLHTLRLQRGPMSAAECSAFEREAHYLDAVLLRRCDDRGKLQGLATPGLAAYRTLIESLATGAQR